MSVIVAKDNGVRWRVFEREMLEKHFGQVMSRLVKDGKVIRIKPGVFKLAKFGEGEIRAKEEIKNQLNLF
jgi:hypothetical protein